MKERPILFSAPMIRALLAGTKTQTRRVAPIAELDIRQHDRGMVTWGVKFSRPVKGAISSHSGGKLTEDQARNVIASMFCPYGVPGDRLWVRETHAIVPRTAYRCSDGVQQTLRPDDDHDAAIYREGWERSNGGFRWRPSIHMPRWASRITLEIVAVRVERLQDISEADAIAEGINRISHDREGYYYHHERTEPNPHNWACPIDAYRQLWAQINGAGSWDANPWVWIVEFTRAQP